MTDSVLAPVVAFVGTVLDRGCPGIVVGLSGTDSALAFVAAADAMRARGMAHRLTGVHYAASPIAEGDRLARILEASPGYRTAERFLLPWLRERAPGAEVVVAHGPRTDPQRWADLFDRSLEGVDPRQPQAGQGAWVMGTRNRTEDALGTYSNLSAAASFQPLVATWKSDVLAACVAMGVPAEVVASSRQVDCDCGRFDFAAAHLEEVDDFLRADAGSASACSRVAAFAPDVLAGVVRFVGETRGAGAFKRLIPYRPDAA